MRLSESLDISIDHGTVERISLDGVVTVDQTVMFYVGERRIAKRALLLGVVLVVCHILDGFLTFFGMEIFGVAAEGNGFLRHFMEMYGHGTTLFIAKSFAIALSIGLMFVSHQRKWVRNLMFGTICIYLMMAVFPWFYILSEYYAKF